MFFRQSWISVLLRCKFVDLSIQPILNFLLSWIPVMQHQTSLYANPGPSNRTIYCSNPGSELSLPNKSLHYWPFRHQSVERGLKSHPKQYGGILEPSFCTPEMVVNLVYSSYTCLHAGFLALCSTLQYLCERVQLAFAQP